MPKTKWLGKNQLEGSTTIVSEINILVQMDNSITVY